MTFKQSFGVIVLSAAVSVGSVWTLGKYQQHQAAMNFTSSPSIFQKTNFVDGAATSQIVDFEKAATKAAPAVVHIKTRIKPRQVSAGPEMQENPFKDFFGDDFGDLFGGRGGPTLTFCSSGASHYRNEQKRCATFAFTSFKWYWRS